MLFNRKNSMPRTPNIKIRVDMFNPFSLQNKTIVITGSSSGIGRQCAIDCSKMGATVALFGRNLDRLKETQSMLVGYGHKYFSVDLAESEIISSIITEVKDSMGRIDGVVNCAGISGVFPLKTMNVKRMESFIKTNVFSALELTRECVKKKNFNPEGGSIVFLSSVMGLVGEKGKSLYGLTKGALISAVKALACEFADRKIRFNCISPGAILTPINATLPYMSDPDAKEHLTSQHLLGLGNPSDISNGVIYLLSNASRWVTGQNLIIDGGYTVR